MTEAFPIRQFAEGSNRIGDERVVSSEDGSVHYLNATAAFIWEFADGSQSFDKLVELLRQHFAVPPEVDLAAEVKACCDVLVAKGLLRWVSAQPGVIESAKQP